MGWSDLFPKEVLGGGVMSAAGSAVDFGLQALGNAVLPMSKAQRQQNEFASFEAQKAREFSAQEAEINRDWQEEMYAKYNSLSGKIAQAREAGVNPMYAVTGSATSPMSASPSSPAAPVASPGSVSPIGQISDMVGAALGFSKLSAEINNIKAATRQQNALALKTELESLWVGKLNSQTIKESNRRIQSADVSDAEKVANTNLLIEKIFTEQSTQQEKAQNIMYLASQIEVNEANLGLIIAKIQNVEADSTYKAALTAGVLISNEVNDKYLKRLMVSEINLNNKEAERMTNEIRKMRQEYGHDKVVYAFEEMIKKAEASNASYFDASNYTGVNRVVRQFLNEFETMFSFNGTMFSK